MGLEDNKAIARRYFGDLWNAKRPEVIDEIARPDCVIHLAPGQAHRPPNLHVWFEHALVAFPDVQFTVLDLFAEGDRVGVRWEYIATHTGEFLGLPATGKRVTDTGINIFRIETGKIAEFWLVQDSLGLLQQLGMIERKSMGGHPA